ncbi:MAG: hypothetical protein RIS64_4139 [Bacteroidota bacterium]|jgi:hypothetical protein
MKNCIKAAIWRWSCATGVRFTYSDIATTDGLAVDTKSTVVLTPLGIGNTIAKTSIVYSFCTSSLTTTPVFPIVDIDIAINTAYLASFFYDTTGMDVPANKMDFFTIILHELGHAHLLSHTNNETDLMYWNGGSEPFVVSGIDRRTIRYLNQKAGDVIVDKSSTSTYGLSCSRTMKPLAKLPTPCRLTNAVHSLETLPMTIYPNPFANEVYITCDESLLQGLTLFIYDATGGFIKQQRIYHTTQTIDMEALSSGVYFFKIQNDSLQTIKKVVCVK